MFTIRFCPISESDIPASESSHVGHNGEQEEDDQRAELEHAKEVFQLAIDVDSQHSHDGEDEPEDQGPSELRHR